MGKGLALFGLILIIVGLLPIILPMVGVTMLNEYFFMLNLIAPIDIGGYLFSDIMLILIGLGVILLIVGAVR